MRKFKKVKRKLALMICYILVMSITMSSVIVFAEDSIGLLPAEGDMISEEVQGNVLPNDGAEIPNLLPENGNAASTNAPSLLPENLPSQLPVEATTNQSQDIKSNTGTMTVELTYGNDTIATGGTLTFKDLNVAELKFKLTGSRDKNRRVTFTIPKGLELVSGTGIRNLDANGNTVEKGYTPREIFMFGYNYPVWNLDPKEPVEGILPAPDPIMSKSGTLEYTIVDETDSADIWIKVKMNRDFVNYNLTGQLRTLLDDIEVELTGTSGNTQKFNFEIQTTADKGRLAAFALSVNGSQFPERSTDVRLSYDRRHPYEDAYMQNLYDPEFEFTFNSKAKLTLISPWTEESRKDNGDNTTTVKLKYSGLINLSNVVFGSLLYDGTNFPVDTICEVKLENLSYRSLFYDNSKSQLEVSTVNQLEARIATTKIIVKPIDFEVGFHKESGFKEAFLESNTDEVILFSAEKKYIKGGDFFADIKFRGDFDTDLDNVTKVVMGMPALGTPKGGNLYDPDRYPYFTKITVKYEGDSIPTELYSGETYSASHVYGPIEHDRRIIIGTQVVYDICSPTFRERPSLVTITAPNGKAFEWVEVELNGNRSNGNNGFKAWGRPKVNWSTTDHSKHQFSIYTKDSNGGWTSKATSKIGGFRWKNPEPTFELEATEGIYDTEPYTYSQAEYNFLRHSVGNINPVVGLLQLKGYTGENTKDEIKISINVDEQDAVRVIRFPYGYKPDKEKAIEQVKEVKWEFFDDPTTYIWINDGGKPPFGYDSTGGVIDAPGQVGGLDEKRFKSLEVTLDGWGSSPKESSISLRGYLKDREVTGKKGQHQIKITAKSQGGNETEIYSGNIGREFLPQTSAAVHIATNDLEVNAGASGKLNFRINGNMYNKQTIAMVLPRGITVGTVITNVYDPVKKRNLEMVNDTARTRDLTSDEIKKAFGANTTIKAAKLYVFNLENQNINSKRYYHGGWQDSGYNVTAELKVATWHADTIYDMSQILYAGTNQNGVSSFRLYRANEGKNIDNFINLGTTTKIVTGRENDKLEINVNPGISVRAEAAGSDGIFKAFIAGNDDTATILKPSEMGTVRYTITNNSDMAEYTEKDVYLFLPVPNTGNKAFAKLSEFDLKIVGKAKVTDGNNNADKIEIKYTKMTSSNLDVADRKKYFTDASDTLVAEHNIVIVKLSNVTYEGDKSIVIDIPVEAPDKTLKTKPNEKIYTNMAPKYMFPFKAGGNYTSKDLYDKDINNPIQFGFYNPEWTVNFKNVLMHENGSITEMKNPVINDIKVTNDDPIYEANSTVAAGNKLPSDPTMNGHVFEGWYLDNNLQTPFIAYDGTNGVDATKITKNTTIYAKWTSTNANYTIKHWKEDSGGNSWTVFVTDTETKSGKIGERPTFNSKTYAGFVNSQKPTTYEKNGTNASTNPLTIAADGTLVVNLYYDLIRYNVEYSEGTGTELKGQRTIEIFHGQKPTSVPTVTAEKDYEWSDKWEDEDKKVYTSQQVKDLSIVKSMRFTAVADLLPLAKVTLNYDGGTNRDTGNDRDTFEGGEGSNIPFPTKDKITRGADDELIGWEVTSTISWGSEKFGARGTNTTYRAKYGTLGTVSFDMNAPDSKPASIANKRLLVGDKLTSSSFWPDVSGETKGKEITRPGYAFAGWYTDDKLEDKDKVNDTIEMKASQTLNLYAKWIPGLDTPYKLIHHKEQIGGGVIKEEEDLKGETGGFAAVRPKTFIGYTFKANNTNYENSSVSTSQNTPLPIIADGSLKVNLYYDLKEYNVKFLANNATLTGTADFTVKHGDKVSAVPQVTPNTDYKWNEKWRGSDGGDYTSDDIKKLAITDNIIFTATATLKDLPKVKLDFNGGISTKPTEFDGNPDEKITFPTKNELTLTGYELTGWTPDKLITWDKGKFGPRGTIAKYTAIWTEKGTVRFHLNAIDSIPDNISEKELLVGEMLASASFWSEVSGETPGKEITRQGYTFDGWYTDIGLTSKVSDTTEMLSGGLELYAKWIADNQTLTLNANDGDFSGTTTKTATIATGTKLKPTLEDNANQPSRQGYSFAGWYKEKECTTKVEDDAEMLAGGLTVYAKWTARTDTKYKLVHNKETLGGGYIKEEEEETGTTGAEATVKNKSYIGYKIDTQRTTYENDNTSAQSSKLPIAADGSLSINLYYDLNKYEIKFSATNATIDGDKSDVTVTIKHGEKVSTVPTVIPNVNHQWDNKWKDGNGKEYTSDEIKALEITENITFTATATLLPAPEVNLDFGGGQDELGNATRKIIGSEGESVTIVGEDKITRDGYVLIGWNPSIPSNFGAGGTTSTHTAVWIEKYTITASSDTNGRITPTGVQTVTKGEDKTFTFTANAGYKIDQVLIDGVNDANAVTSGSYTFTNVQANKTIEVTFSKKSGGGSDSSQPDPDEKPEVTPETGTKPKLTTKRIAYIVGYEDGSFRPDNAMTRAEVAVVLSNLIEEKPENVNTYINFNDTNQNGWYADKVGHVVSLGIMGGYPDGSFRPYDKVTRAEFATIASNFDELEEKREISFIDLAIEHWAHDYISMAISRNWVGGYKDGSFRPESGITRAEVVVVMNNMLNRSGGKVEIEQIITSFKDVSLEHWAYHPIVEATHSHNYIESEKN